MKYRSVLLFLFIFLLPFRSLAEEETIQPAYPVPEYVQHLLQVASEEVGYVEEHGRTKYGA